MTTPGRKRGTASQAARVLHMIRYLAHRWMTVPELAHRFDVSERQVRRDLEVIHSAWRKVEMLRSDGETRFRLRERPTQ